MIEKIEKEVKKIKDNGKEPIIILGYKSVEDFAYKLNITINRISTGSKYHGTPIVVNNVHPYLCEIVYKNEEV